MSEQRQYRIPPQQNTEIILISHPVDNPKGGTVPSNAISINISSEKETIITEASIGLSVNGDEWLHFLCTPMDLEALASGFLFTSGIIQSFQEISSLRICDEGTHMDVWLTHAAEKPRLWQKNSGCSGGLSAPDMDLTPIPASAQFKLLPTQIFEILSTFYQSQELYSTSGGVHTSALFSNRELIYSVEDIGRHNTVDKLAGKMLMNNLHPPECLIMTTGRISLEMMQKAAIMQAPFVVSRTSPTSASIQLAQALGITMIGYANNHRLKIYSHPEAVITIP
jgi:FdhD protein